MVEKVQYVGMLFAVLCCFSFLFLSFTNAKKVPSVKYFRRVLLACMIWVGGGCMMRLGSPETVGVWTHVSYIGLFMVPVLIYYFLFCVLKKDGYWVVHVFSVMTILMLLVNVKTEFFLPVPRATRLENGYMQFQYSQGNFIGIGMMLLFEMVFFLWFTYVAHILLEGKWERSKKLFPLMIGMILLFLGNALNLLPGNEFPFGELGACGLAISFIIVLSMEGVLDVSERVVVGSIYTAAIVLIVFPVSYASVNAEKALEAMTMEAADALVYMSGSLIVWSIFVFSLARTIVGRITSKREKQIKEILSTFQNSTMSIFFEDELYETLVHAIETVIDGARVYVFAKKEKRDAYYIAVMSKNADTLNQEEVGQISRLTEEKELEKHPEIVLIKYNNKVKGFCYIIVPPKKRVKSSEWECIYQIAAYASACIKNIDTYQVVYQRSIRDSVTGLYNRYYFEAFIAEKWLSDQTQTMIYLDVDGFKLFNELYGQKCGDDILHWCGNVVLEAVGEMGEVFRIGSNEYLAYVPYVEKDKINAIVKEVQRRLADTDDTKPKVLQPVTMSIGIAIYPASASDGNSLFKQAQRASYFAKKNGRNCSVYYEAEMESDKQEKQRDAKREQIAPTIYALAAAIDAKDAYTFKHSSHVSEYAVLLAKRIGLPSEEVEIVREAGLLHDIGKIGIPEQILKKEGRLTDEEFAIMKSHVTNSIEMIHYLPNMNYVIPAVISHHERYDGKGYPRGIKGEEIPLLGRILTVCDCFDAIVSKRSYKAAMSIEYAMEELEKNKGTQFDPELAEEFIALIKEGKIVIEGV